jgi:hypothetical protein
MNLSSESFSLFAAICAVVAVFFAWANPLLALAAVRWDRGAFADLGRGVAAVEGHRSIRLLRWSMLADMAGFYLLLLPLAVAVWHTFLPDWGAWATLGTAAGVGYLLFGAAGAAILAATAGWLDAERGEPQGRALYRTLVDAIALGLWATLNPFLAGVWWLALGLMLLELQTLLGALVLVAGAMTFLRAIRIPALFLPADAIYLLLSPPLMAAVALWLAYG